ncbi:c-type cytochrome [Thermoflavimicrobium dichotomicum]|uniref:Menaquinol-cytochrome c reductase cytochrome b/c subunit n=1 Tax=Thermoflavimicrobium dichotomicum TaxID=46223 RepID=A0A1I3S1C6_9BACL|nr:cytochrome c [Thermoflavimicrobium dichotomicum]SFJ51331.1 menaquinol-cytochrome c reductase cytochrome b/c subunit [Thermoflavimicrobium dichotomicum]
MKVVKYLGTALIGTGLLFGCSPEKPQEKDTTFVQEKQSAEEKLYQNYCLNCHGEQLRGGYGPGLQKVGRKYTEKEIQTIIEKGMGKMPAQNYIPKEEQLQLAKWLANQK